MNFVDKDLLSVQEARILMERAAQAKEALALFEQEKLDRIAAAMLEAAEGAAFPAGPSVGGRDQLRELAG